MNSSNISLNNFIIDFNRKNINLNSNKTSTLTLDSYYKKISISKVEDKTKINKNNFNPKNLLNNSNNNNLGLFINFSCLKKRNNREEIERENKTSLILNNSIIKSNDIIIKRGDSNLKRVSMEEKLKEILGKKEKDYIFDRFVDKKKEKEKEINSSFKKLPDIDFTNNANKKSFLKTNKISNKLINQEFFPIIDEDVLKDHDKIFESILEEKEEEEHSAIKVLNKLKLTPFQKLEEEKDNLKIKMLRKIKMMNDPMDKIILLNVNAQKNQINQNMTINQFLRTNAKRNYNSLFEKNHYIAFENENNASFIRYNDINNKETDFSLIRNNDLSNIFDDSKYQQNEMGFFKKSERSFFYDENNKPIIRPIELKKNTFYGKYNSFICYEKDLNNSIKDDNKSFIDLNSNEIKENNPNQSSLIVPLTIFDKNIKDTVQNLNNEKSLEKEVLKFESNPTENDDKMQMGNLLQGKNRFNDVKNYNENKNENWNGNENDFEKEKDIDIEFDNNNYKDKNIKNKNELAKIIGNKFLNRIFKQEINKGKINIYNLIRKSKYSNKYYIK
jgi:hypothetical protein